MPFFETFVAWRYIRRIGATPRGLTCSLWGAVATLLVGLGLFFLTTHKAVAALLILAGGVGAVASALLSLFTTFAALSMLGLTLGLAVFICVTSVTAGLSRALTEKVLGVHAHVVVLGDGDIGDPRAIVPKLARSAGVVEASPFVLEQMMIAAGGVRVRGVMVKGIPAVRSARLQALSEQVVAPRPSKGGGGPRVEQVLSPTEGQLPSVIIGHALAKKMDLRVGSPVRLISPLAGREQTPSWSSKIVPRTRNLRVGAIFDSGLTEFDERLVYIDLKTAQGLVGRRGITGVELTVHDVDRSPQLARQIEARLGASYRAVDWSELNRDLFSWLKLQRLFVEGIIGGLLAIIVCFNIVASLAILVLRKGREIAALGAMGLSFWGVARVFQACGLMIWSVGTGVGLTGGYLGTLLLRRYRFPIEAEVFMLSELPVRVAALDLAFAAACALGLCLLATLYPAWRATRKLTVAGLEGR